MGTACVTLDKACPRTTVDVALLFGYLTANEWEIVDDVADADLILMTSCAVHDGAEQSAFERLAQIEARRRASSRLIVLGCVAGISHERLSVVHPGAIAVPPARMGELDDLLGARVRLADIPEVRDRGPLENRARRSMGRAAEGRARRLVRRVLRSTGFRSAGADAAPDTGVPGARVCSLRIAWGCANDCTYCAIRTAAGPLRSKPIEAILAEFDGGLAAGFKRFEVIAGDVGCWGLDLDTDITVLLSRIFEREGDYKLIIDDFNPRWLVLNQDVLVPLLSANSRRIECLMLPVQSGSDLVLAAMQRGYSADELQACLMRLRDAADLHLVTHVLVGFPGEDEREFEKTRSLLSSVRFDRVDVYPYADRPHAPAAALPGKLLEATIAARCARLTSEFPALVADYS
jgi:threonylcarbamoyladenosine tRNA methylthiotransferase CDKAL1